MQDAKGKEAKIKATGLETVDRAEDKGPAEDAEMRQHGTFCSQGINQQTEEQSISYSPC